MNNDYIKVQCIGIDWDIDADEDGTIPTPEELGLPTTATLEVAKDELETIEDDAADMLSDKYGFCINSIETITVNPNFKA